MMALRSREKNTANFAFPSPVNTHWPENCRDIIKNPKKYRWSAGIPDSSREGSLLKIRMKNPGATKITAHAAVV